MNTKTFTNSCKLFVKTIGCILPYIILLGLINWLLVVNYQTEMSNGASAYFGKIRGVSYLLFAFYTFISYEFFRKSKDSSLEETLESYGLNGRIVQISQLVVVLVCTVITSLNVAVYSLIGIPSLEFPKSFIINIVKLNLLDIVLLSVTAVFIGMLIAKLKNRFSGYTVLATVLICVSPAMNTMLVELNYLHIPLYKLRDFLNFMPPDLDAVTEKLYGFPLERYRFALMFFWILLVIVIFIFSWLKNKAFIRNVVCGILSVAIIGNLIVYINRGSVLIAYRHPESATESAFRYYQKNAPIVESADFAIEMYDADFTITDRLKATVSMKIGEQTGQESYKFTLYHNYKIKKLYDENNNELKFKQSGDYFEVFKPNGKNLEHITVEYSGFNEAFYSNRQAVFLPGFFAFYPQPGYNVVYLLNGNKYISSNNEACNFKVNVNSKHKLTSNLDGDGTNFEGIAQNITLIGGYYEETKINGYDTIMYPLEEGLTGAMDNLLSDEYQIELNEVKKLFGETENVDFKDKKIISIPFSLTFNSVAANIYIYDDSIILNPYDIGANPYYIFNEYLPNTIGKEDTKRAFVTRVYYAAKDEKKPLLSESGFTNKSAQVGDMITIKMEELGVEHVAPIIYQYLKDESNTQDELEFLTNIK